MAQQQSSNGTVKLYLGAAEKYVGDFTTSEDYDLHSISWTLDEETGVAIGVPPAHWHRECGKRNWV